MDYTQFQGKSKNVYVVFTLCKRLTYWLGFGMVFSMASENIPTPANLPVEISDAAWQSILPFLKEIPNVYGGNCTDLTVFVRETRYYS